MAEGDGITELDVQVANEANKKYGKTELGRKSLSDTEVGSQILKDTEESIRIKEENIRDALTGLFNRRYADKFLSEFDENQSLGVIFLDLDHFKDVNDTYGHDAGDNVLREEARLLQEEVRSLGNGESDKIVRWGGEEVVILFPGFSDGKKLTERAEQIRRKIEESEFRISRERTIKMTVSAGVARRRSGESPLESVNRADQAMYLSKKGTDGANGRNRVSYLG